VNGSATTFTHKGALTVTAGKFDPHGFDQCPAWQAPEIQLEDGRTLVIEST